MRRLLLALVLLAACGGGADTLSKQELIAQADERCRQFDASFAEAEQPQTSGDYVAFLQAFGASLDRFHDDLADLEPPADGEDELAALLDGVETARATVQEAEDAARAGDLELLPALFERAEAEAGAANEELAAYGFRACAA